MLFQLVSSIERKHFQVAPFAQYLLAPVREIYWYTLAILSSR